MMGIQIYEQIITNDNGEVVGKIAILRGAFGTDNPYKVLDEAVKKYVGNAKCIQFVDIKFNDPWTRIITTDLSKFEFLNERQRKIKKFLSNNGI